MPLKKYCEHCNRDYVAKGWAKHLKTAKHQANEKKFQIQKNRKNVIQEIKTKKNKQMLYKK